MLFRSNKSKKINKKSLKKIAKHSKKLKKRLYKFGEASDYFSSFDKYPLIKSEQQYEYEWRKKMFIESPNDESLQKTYETFLPLKQPNLKNVLEYAVSRDNLDQNSTFFAKDFKQAVPNFKFRSADNEQQRTLDFKQKLKTFSNDLFNKDFDWNCQGHGKVVVSGGCVNTCVTETNSISNITPLTLDEEPGDIDLFLINPTNIEEQVKYLLDFITKQRKTNLIMRSKNAITILGGGRNVQIILRSYTTTEQLICGFDVDSCCFAYDGKDVITNSRGYRSVIFGSNVIDPYTSSKNGVERLIKYLNRGYNMFLPFGYDTMKNFITFLFIFLFMFSFSQERERMSKEQYRAAQKLFLLEKLNFYLIIKYLK